jgi:hypothetical protein
MDDGNYNFYFIQTTKSLIVYFCPSRLTKRIINEQE